MLLVLQFRKTTQSKQKLLKFEELIWTRVGYHQTPHHEVLHSRRHDDDSETETYAGSSHCVHAPATSRASTATTCYSFRHHSPFSSPYSVHFSHCPPFSSSPSPNLSLCYHHGFSHSPHLSLNLFLCHCHSSSHSRETRVRLSSTASFAERESRNPENPALPCHGQNVRACPETAAERRCGDSGDGERRESGCWKSDGPWLQRWSRPRYRIRVENSRTVTTQQCCVALSVC